MPEVIYYVACSLDGFIATPDGGLDWLTPFEASGEDYGYAEFYGSVDAVVLGSRTFEQALTFGEWPYPGKPSWVMSSRAIAPGRDDVTVTSRTPAEVVADIELLEIGRIWLVGGGALAGSFQAAGLITEFVVSFIPVILGEGVPLLGAAGARETLRLVSTKAYPDGVVQARYVGVDDGRRVR